MLNSEKKVEVIKQFQRKERDTGSSEVQIALLSARIRELQGHFAIHKKDVHSRLGLLKLVSKRRKLLKYLKNTDLTKYRSLIETLELRG